MIQLVSAFESKLIKKALEKILHLWTSGIHSMSLTGMRT